MPRITKAMKLEMLSETLNGLKINRTVGLEVEGYMKTHPQLARIQDCVIKKDGSLRNSDWLERQSYGCEVVTGKLTDLNMLDTMFDDMNRFGWSSRGIKPGMHIHVDVRDFTLQDKCKAAWFGQMVENIMFLFVKNYRYHNSYCHMLSEQWKLVPSYVPFDSLQTWGSLIDIWDVIEHIRSKRMGATRHRFNLSTNKYNWLNIFSTQYPTMEFRIFHTINNAVDGKRFAYLAHQFTETVKNSTIEQLQFIADSINNEASVDLKAKKFLVALGITYDLPILNDFAREEIENQIRQAVSV